MNRLLKILFFVFVVKPLVLLGLGLNLVNRQNLPTSGPAIIAANHNSHLDTLILMSLFPLSIIHRVRPVAAADYFLKNRLLAWFCLNVLGIIPINRQGTDTDKQAILADSDIALSEGDILIIFPEGSRGQPEKMSRVKKGIYHLTKECENRIVIPVMIRGLGAALPRGTALFVPFNCDVIIGESIASFKSADDFVETMCLEYEHLKKFCVTQVAAPEDNRITNHGQKDEKSD